MVAISIISVVLFFFALVGATVTGRKIWLIILIWSVPTFGLARVAPSATEVNGLIVVISYFMIFITIYSLWGVKLWHTAERKNLKLMVGLLFAINFLICSYYVYQCINLGYIMFLKITGTKAMMAFITIVSGLAISAIMTPVSMTALDMFFSKKESFALIQCRPLKWNRKKNVFTREVYAIKGIQNGKEYVLNMTRKAFILLKPQKSFVLEAKRGVLGGVYIQGDLYKDEGRRNKRVNKILVSRGIFAVILATVVILFIVRVKLGIGFQEIFESFGKEVFGWKK